MAIVRSARLNVKIDHFFLADGNEKTELWVRDAMRFFGAKPLSLTLQLPLERIPDNVVLVENKIQSDNLLFFVTTVIQYRTIDGTIVSNTEMNKAYPDERLNDALIKRLLQANIFRLMQELTGITPSPWGILRGVRPTKIVHRLLGEMLSLPEIEKRLQEQYLVYPVKAKLLTDIAAYQRPWLEKEAGRSNTVSIYIGIPYCPSRCLYCSFPAYVLPAKRSELQAFLDDLYQDIRAAGECIRRHSLSVQTIYIGGGTPTSLNDDDFDRLLAYIKQELASSETIELTVEAGRPDTVTNGKIEAMVRHGVTRVSVNPQSMQEKTLKLIGRNHSIEDIINIFGKIRQSAIPSVNMDLIAGLPGETCMDMIDTLTKVLQLSPENLTIHTLALKKGSLLKTNREVIELPGEEAVSAMLAAVANYSETAGMIPYYLYRQKYAAGNLENVGYTKPGAECVYNIQIMEENQTVLGIGPNAASKAVTSPFSLKSLYFPKDLITYHKRLSHYLDARSELLAELYER